MAKLKRLEFKEFLTKIEMLIDTREKKHDIRDTFKKNNIEFSSQKLDAGDYSYMMNNIVGNITIERKNSLNELSVNLSTNRNRFINEFKRVPIDFDKYILIENETMDNLLEHKYQTNLTINSFLSNLLLLEKRFNIHIHFMNKKFMPAFILRLCYYNYYENFERWK